MGCNSHSHDLFNEISTFNSASEKSLIIRSASDADIYFIRPYEAVLFKNDLGPDNYKKIDRKMGMTQKFYIVISSESKFRMLESKSTFNNSMKLSIKKGETLNAKKDLNSLHSVHVSP